MTNSSRSTGVLTSLCASLMALPRVDQVMMTRERGLRLLHADVDGRRHVVAVLYPVAEVVVPVDDGRIARPLRARTNDTACDVAHAFGMTLIHGVDNPGRPGGRPMAARNRRLPAQTSLVRERKLTAATMCVTAEATGVALPPASRC